MENKTKAQTSKETLKSKTLLGLKWSLLSRLGSQCFRFIIGIILARLLTPRAFGLLGMIMIFAGFARRFNDLGFGAALIYEQDIKPVYLDTVFWTNIFSGFFLTGLFFFLAPYIAIFFDEPVLKTMVWVVSLDFAIGSFAIIQKTMFRKTMDFKSLAIVKLSRVLIAGVVAIFMAFYGFGVWSLVTKMVLGTLLGVIIFWLIDPWKPALRFSREAFIEMWSYSSNLLGSRIKTYWVRNGDNLLIGRFLSSSALGIFNYAYRIMLFPLSNISNTIRQVMFPAFSSIKQDKALVARIYLRITKIIALITFPLMLGLLACCQNFVIVVFGQQWSGMIPVLRLFSVVGMMQSIGTLSGVLYQSQGRTDLQFKVGLVQGALGISAITAGIFWGQSITYVALAYTIFVFIAYYPNNTIATSTINLRFNKVLKGLFPTFLCALAMGIVVYAAGYFSPGGWPLWKYLIIQIVCGILIYSALIHIFKLSAYTELKAFIIEQLQLSDGG